MASIGTRGRAWRLMFGAGLLVLGGIGLSNALVARDARDRSPSSRALSPGRAVAIVPGAATHDGRPLRSLEQRLQTALALYGDRQVKAILVSGNDTPSSPEVTVMKDWLLAHGVPSRAIWSDVGGSRTRQTMLNAASFFDVTDAIICTQDLYLPRALFLAGRAGIDAVGIGVPTRLGESVRGAGMEALKTALAVVESVGEG